MSAGHDLSVNELTTVEVIGNATTAPGADALTRRTRSGRVRLVMVHFASDVLPMPPELLGRVLQLLAAAPTPPALRRCQQVSHREKRLGHHPEVGPHPPLVTLNQAGFGQNAQVVADGRL